MEAHKHLTSMRTGTSLLKECFDWNECQRELHNKRKELSIALFIYKMILHKSPNLTEPQFNSRSAMLLLVKNWYLPTDKKYCHTCSSSSAHIYEILGFRVTPS